MTNQTSSPDGLRITGADSVAAFTIASSNSVALLKLNRTADGKVHAEYQPGNLTAAAEALVEELAKIQQPVPSIHTEGQRLVEQIHGLHAIRARLEEDRAEYGSTAGDASIRDRDRLLDIIKDRATRLGAIDQLHTREIINVHPEYGTEYWCPACATYWPCNTTKAIHGGTK